MTEKNSTTKFYGICIVLRSVGSDLTSIYETRSAKRINKHRDISLACQICSSSEYIIKSPVILFLALRIYLIYFIYVCVLYMYAFFHKNCTVDIDQ